MTSLRSIDGLLLVLIGLSGCAAMYSAWHDQQVWFAVFKPTTTILVIGLFMWRSLSFAQRLPSLALVALLACLLGDVFLLSDDYFVFGLSAFFVAHLCFIVCFVGLRGWQLKPTILISGILIGGAYYATLAPELSALAIPVAAYLLIIVIMMVQAVGMALSQKGNGFNPECLVAFGAVAFGISDSVIALNKFLLPFHASIVVVLTLYWLAVSLLAFALPKLALEASKRP